MFLKKIESLVKSDKPYFFLITLFFWRVYLFVVAYFAQIFIPQFKTSFPYIETLKNSGLPYWAWSFGNFDGVHYLRIANDGYVYQFTQAFFPLYPILIKITSFLSFGNYFIAGLLISNILFLFSVYVFHKLIKESFNKSVANWACLFLIFFPTSFYFGSIYTESLFLFLMTSAFYFYQQKKYLLASVLGALASSTRIIGIFLSPALIKTKSPKNFLSLMITPLGLFLYMVYLKIEFNNPFYFLSAQSAFGQERSTNKIILLPQVIYRSLEQVLTTKGIVLFNSSFDLAATLFCIILLLMSLRFVKKSWIIFSFLAILTPTLTGSLISMPRYILIAFPMYIVLGSINRAWIKISLLIFFFIMLTITTALFTRGYWIA